MRNPVLASTAVVAALLYGATASAAPLNVPSNVRIVQKSNTDASGRIYPTLQAALSSIPTTGTSAPSATNPYVVKVMPGVYDLGTASLQMRSFVDVEGSGRENTIITASNSNVPGADPESGCAVGTVVMANDSAIRNVKIVQRVPMLNGDYKASAALVVKGMRVRAEHVAIEVGSDLAVGGRNIGICTTGAFSEGRVLDADVQVHNGLGQSSALHVWGGRLDVRCSRLAATAGPNGGPVRILNDNNNATTTTIANSSMEASGPTVNGFFVDGSTLDLSNSTVVLNGASGYTGDGATEAVYATNALTITHTRILNSGVPVTYSVTNPGLVRIAASELPGDVSGLAGARIVGSWNESFAPIPNQP